MPIYDNGKAPVTEVAKSEEPNVPRSAFNMSRVRHVSGIIGALMPIDVLETLPNEDYEINYACMIESRNPLLKPMKSGMKITFHSYYMANRNMWKGWDMFIDRGRDGKHVASIPKYYPAYTGRLAVQGEDKDVANDITTLTPCSPADYMGIPIVAYDNNMTNKNYCYTPIKVTEQTKVNEGYGASEGNTTKWGLSALPFHMYDAICKHYYWNKNLLSNNTGNYPIDEDDEKIPFVVNIMSGYINNRRGNIGDYSKATAQDGESCYYIPSNDEDVKAIACPYNTLHFRQFRGDYFNSANPFPDLIRGNANDLKFDLEPEIDWSNVVASTEGPTNGYYYVAALADTKKLAAGRPATNDSYSNWEHDKYSDDTLVEILNKVKITQNAITLNRLRQLMVLEKFMQRNATTDGSYKEFIKAQFGYTPKINDCKPIYIGGSVMDIENGTVTQTSESGTTLLGKQAGTSYGSAMNYIGKFHSDDYGYIMTIACIVPDLYYENQGLDTIWTRTEQNQFYFPLLNNLEPQAIKNKELFVSGNAEYDENVWGYCNRFEDMKSRRNIISGLMACPQAVQDSQGWCKRRFDKNNPPQLNMKFLTMSPANIDLVKMGFSSNNEIPYNLAIGCMVEKISPMPITAMPSDLGIKY